MRWCNVYMGLLKIVNIYESVQNSFARPPSRSPKAYYKMLIKTNFVSDFRKKRAVVSNPTPPPPPLPYPLYAFINVNNFERPRICCKLIGACW